jgi:sortase A
MTAANHAAPEPDRRTAPPTVLRRAALPLTLAVAAVALLLLLSLPAGPSPGVSEPVPAGPSASPHALATLGPTAPASTTAPTPGQVMGTITIPALSRLGYPDRFAVKEGVDKPSVLNTGAVGHYPDTALPGQLGNFGLAAHRNTHGEPFRYLNHLRPGDTVLIQTQQTSYTYLLDRELPQTDADDYAVLDPVPAQAGYTKPARYITLTTCTPEFTSLYRMIWWGHLVTATTRKDT